MPLLTDKEIKAWASSFHMGQGYREDGAKYARNLYEERIREKDGEIKEYEAYIESFRKNNDSLLDQILKKDKKIKELEEVIKESYNKLYSINEKT